MTQPLMSVSRRTRITPFSHRIGSLVKAYSVYNHTLIPTIFESVEADYHHLKKHVQVWDVTCEKQVELKGKDASLLVQKMTPRSLAKMKVGQCKYIPMVDETGGMINDPVALKLGEDYFWLSLADSDILLWAKGLAVGLGLKVNISEPAISPLAVQGPKSDDLMARVFGEEVSGIKFFNFEKLTFQGIEMVVARSGWSKQGGFEIYVPGWDIGEVLWDALFEDGKEFDVRPGCPNLIERIESGLLSYGNDMTQINTPFECGLEKYCHTDALEVCLGGEAIKQRLANDSKRQVRGLVIEGDKVPGCVLPWKIFAKMDGINSDQTQVQAVGEVTSAVWSPDMKANIAFGIIDESHWNVGNEVQVKIPTDINNSAMTMRKAKVCHLPFI